MTANGSLNPHPEYRAATIAVKIAISQTNPAPAIKIEKKSNLFQSRFLLPLVVPPTPELRPV